MLRKVDNKDMGKSNLGWLRSSFHFSFAEYWNPYNLNFGKLRVLNDDLVEVGTGFDTHPHENMEIVSYIVSGEITHGDSMGNKKSLGRGNVQYMSAGTGVLHSEHNYGNEMLRLLQIWIYPDKKGYTPNYGDFKFDWSLRENKWLNIVSGKDGDAQIKINQDVNIYVLELDKEKEIEFKVAAGRQAYLVQIEGAGDINAVHLNEKDALEIVEEDIKIKAEEKSHYIVLEMKRE
ncbi:MAG: pirin family protein [Clostridium sp.]|uniref:pirin family protein n=1 Tax=Clostridium sp. TaxID=1506 RepID=UPI003F3C7B7D